MKYARVLMAITALFAATALLWRAKSKPQVKVEFAPEPAGPLPRPSGKRVRHRLVPIGTTISLLVGMLAVVNFAAPQALAAPTTRSKTVEFFAGQHTGATGANQNVKNDFAKRTFRLAETGADIVSAYVELGAQIGANTSTSYASAVVYFDACASSCTPSTTAFPTTGSLGTSSGASQYVRLRADVTAEAQMAAYAGAGVAQDYAVGYCFASTTCSGTTSAQIFAATAKLVITYTYTASTTNQTNTVFYPLESATDVGSKGSTQGGCTLGTDCPSFSYNVAVPEISTGSQLDQWFDVNSSTLQATTTDVDMTARVGTNTTSALIKSRAALGDNGAWMNYRYSGLSGYANNTAQTLQIGISGAASTSSYGLGGETVVTYTNTANAATRTKTVSYPVGEVVTAVDDTAKSALVGPTVYLPEAGATIKKAWFRINSTGGGTGDFLNISSKVGSRSETSQVAYDMRADAAELGGDGFLVHVIPSTEYAELQAATAATGKAVQMSAQWSATAPGGSVSAELMITYSYTGDSSGYVSTQRIFAGQQTAAPATTYSTANGALNPSLPESTGTIAIRGAGLKGNAKNTGTTQNEAFGSNLATAACTATATSTADTGGHHTLLTLNKDVTATVTNSESQTYTACFRTTEASVFTGELMVTHQWIPPPYLTQSAFRWYTNADSTAPDSALAAENTGAVLNSTSDPARLRMNVGVTETALSGSSQAFKLQYGTSTSGPWTDVGAAGGGSGGAWWDSSWSSRRKITIDNSASAINLTNFPLRVSLTASNIDYTKTKSGGQDLRFVDGDGTLLDHEIDTWNSSGTSEVWVKVPQIDATSTTDFIYMYYGNSNATALASQAVARVWDDTYKGVWHLNNDPSGTAPQVRDSTSRGWHGTSQGSMTSGDLVAGQIGNALDFDGSNDNITHGNITDLNGQTTVTLSVWMKRRAAGSNVFFGKQTLAGAHTLIIEAYSDGRVYFSVTNGTDAYGTFTLNDTNWHHMALVYDGSQTGNANRLKAYIDGVARTLTFTSTISATTTTNTTPFENGVAMSEYSNGFSDEGRISTAALSPDWIEAEYKAGANTLNSFSSEESNPLWRFHDNATAADRATLGSTMLGSSNVAGSYIESSPTGSNPNAIAVGQYGEWDFSLNPSRASVGTTYYFRMVKSDGTALDAYANYPSVTVRSLLNQEAYRWYANADSTTPGAALATTNTAAVAPVQGTAFRLRTLIHASGLELSAGARNFKLQVAAQSGSCDVAFSGETYADVATGSGAIRYAGNATPADGAAAGTHVDEPSSGHTVVRQTYEEANNVATATTIPAGEDGLWDFALVDNSAAAGTTYCFRIVASDDSLLEAYTVLPEITTYIGPLTSVTWTANNTLTSNAGTRYNYGFTTGSTATVSRITASIPAGTTGTNRYLAVPVNGTGDNQAKTPDSVANSVTGALDLRAKIAPNDWTPTSSGSVLGKWSSDTGYSYALYLDSSGTLSFGRSVNGTATEWTASTTTPGFTDGSMHWVRVTYVPDNGSGSRVTSFYTSSDGYSWSALGTPVTVAGTSNNYDSPTEVVVGGFDYERLIGKIYYAEIRNGVNGTVVSIFDPNSAAAAVSPSAWTAPTGEVWTVYRTGTNLSADIASDLTINTNTNIGVGTAVLRMIDGVALYTVTSPVPVTSGMAISLALTGFTNTPTPGTYTSTITTYDNSGTPVAVNRGTTNSVTFAANVAPEVPATLVQSTTNDIILSTGSWLSGTDIKFSGQLSDGNNPDTLSLCIEVDVLGQAFSNTEDACSSTVSYAGSALTASITRTLSDQYEFHWQARVRDAAGLYSAWVSYDSNLESVRDFGLDTTAPAAGSVYDGLGSDVSSNDGSLTALSANWTAFVAGISGLAKYEYAIGTSAGGTQTRTWTDVGTSVSVNATGLSLRTGQVYYVSVRATDNAGNTTIVTSDGQTVLSILSFGINSSAINFDLGTSNSHRATQALELHVNTNTFDGYSTTAFLTTPLTNAGGSTIPNFAGGSYGAPDAWQAGEYGFGFTTDDPWVNGSNRFGGSPCLGGNIFLSLGCFAPFDVGGPGSVVIDNQGGVPGVLIDDTYDLTMQIAVAPGAQPAGTYQSTLVLNTVPNF